MSLLDYESMTKAQALSLAVELSSVFRTVPSRWLRRETKQTLRNYGIVLSEIELEQLLADLGWITIRPCQE